MTNSLDDSDDWAEIKALFLAVVEADPSERERLLTNAGSPGSATAVRRLLRELDHEGPLDRSPLEAVGGLAVLPLDEALIGRQIGAYSATRIIGHGGMGTVYEGARTDGQFAQRVAIKTLRVGAASEAVRQRFLRERQIVAALQHPHIAALLDGGITTKGVPYLVLEYVDGVPIDSYCATRRLPIATRLDLVRTVLDAVGYAHRQLVVHRDLKPSNILVTADGVVKLVDFGIAKLLGDTDPETTIDGPQAYTIGYASPEQLHGRTVGTASDIFSLGVVLFKLLTGRLPFDSAARLSQGTEEGGDPVVPLPSSIATTGAATACGLGSATQLAAALRGELDAIVQMALRTEPERRYASTQAFSSDLHAHLRGTPVSARPDTLSYRLRKFARRRWALAAGTAVAAFALMIGSALALWQAHSARTEADRAARVAAFLAEVIGAGDLSGDSHAARLGPGATVGELLDSAVKRVPTSLRGDPAAMRAVYLAIGKAYREQERFRDATHQFDSAIVMARRADGDQALTVGEGLQELGAVESARGEYPRAEQLLEQAQAIYEAHRAIPTAAGTTLLIRLAVARMLQGEFDAAEPLLHRAIADAARRTPGPSAARATALSELGAIYSVVGSRAVLADSTWRHAVAIFDSLQDGNVVEKGNALWYLALAENLRGNLAAAESVSVAALAIFRRAAGPQSQEVAAHLANLASLARRRDDLETAGARMHEAMTILEHRAETNPIIRMRIEMEYIQWCLATGDLATAEPLARKVLADRAGGNPLYIAQAEVLLGRVLARTPRRTEAEQVLVAAVEHARSLLTTRHYLTRQAIAELIQLYQATGRSAQAEPYRRLLVSAGG